MDNLTKQAVLARRAGVSYGKWMAMQETTQPEKKIPEGWLICKHCGNAFKPKNIRKRSFCDWTCQRQAYYESHKQEKLEYMRRRREKLQNG